MAGSVSVKVVRDTGGAGVAALQRRLRAGVHRVLVGVPEGAGNEENGASLAQVAGWVEFGTSDSPERPFLRGGVRTALPLCSRIARHDLAAVAEGSMSMGTALDRQGLAAVGAVKAYMAGPNFAPNAPATIAKKGSSQPTIDHGQVRQAITHIVEGGS